MNDTEFRDRSQLTGFSPHAWHARLTVDIACDDRVVRIHTGMGKTQEILTASFYHQIQRCDAPWPRQLVWCQPIRVLVEPHRDRPASVSTDFKPPPPASFNAQRGVFVRGGGASATSMGPQPTAAKLDSSSRHMVDVPARARLLRRSGVVPTGFARRVHRCGPRGLRLRRRGNDPMEYRQPPPKEGAAERPETALWTPITRMRKHQ